MDVIRGVSRFPRDRGRTVLSIGNFDGVHLAHRDICRQIREEAARRRAQSVVLTFEPHPLSVVAPDRCPPLMTTLDEKLARLEAQGVDAVVLEPFTHELSSMEADDFVRRIIHEGLGAELVVVGFNFHFGKGRAGDVALLKSVGEACGFHTRIAEPFMHLGRRVSSTEIRRHLLAGEVEVAASLLGQPHLVEGPVVRGEGRGRTIGIPTANVDYPPILIPANGVYACRVQVGGRDAPRLPAVTNIGERPTFDSGHITVEAHLLEGGRDLYEQNLRVEFISRLREERRFNGPEELVRQIRADIEEGRRRLA